MVRRNPWRAAVAVGVVLVAAGALLVARGSTPQVVAWFGEPSSAETLFAPGLHLLTTQLLWGVAVGTVGVVVLVGCSAFSLGLRRGRESRVGPPASDEG